MENKRAIAYKFRVGDLLRGKNIMDNERFKFLELGDKKITRVNVIANVIEKFISEGERKFGSITLDDASGQMRVKVFGDDLKKIEDTNQGDSLMVIGSLRFFNNEIYILPEIIKKVDPKFLLVRKLEIENERKSNNSLTTETEKQEVKAVRDRIIEMIKGGEPEQGIDADKIIMQIKTSPAIINQEIQRLLEDGVVYEPRPGRLRYLG